MDNEIFCIDYSQLGKVGSVRVDIAARSIPQLVHRTAHSNDTALLFHSEKVSLSFRDIKTKSDSLAASLLSIGLSPGDRILICGSNESNVFLSILGAARASMVFCVASPNMASSSDLHSILTLGSFKAVIFFKSRIRSDHLYTFLRELAPSLPGSVAGSLSAPSLPALTHVILADEDHLHSGTFTLSDVLGRGGGVSLPSLDVVDESSMASLCQTSGTSCPSRLVAISHYQLLGGARAVNHAFGLTAHNKVTVALPLHRGALLSLLCLSPFLTRCTLIFPDPEPLPHRLFQCISYHNSTVLLSNGVALRLLLKTCKMHQARLSSLQRILLIGERVPSELHTSLQQNAPNAKIIAVGYLLSETASIPIMGDQTINLNKLVGRTITGYQTRVEPLRGSTMGPLLLSPFEGSSFLGYAPDFVTSEWINTGDMAEVDEAGNIHIVSPVADVIYDERGRIFNYKPLERILCLSDLIKGAQIISAGPSSKIVAVCVPKRLPADPDVLTAELSMLCRETGLPIPAFFSYLEDFPRTNTRIQKYKLREWLREGKLPLYNKH